MEVTEPLRVALSQLLEDEERLDWAPDGLSLVRTALSAALAGPEGARALDQLLRLAVVLRTTKAAPELADALGEAIRSLPEGKKALEVRFGTGRSMDRLRGFTRHEDREVPLRAPPEGNAPELGIPLSTLIDPNQRDRRRARSLARKEAKHGHYE